MYYWPLQPNRCSVAAVDKTNYNRYRPQSQDPVLYPDRLDLDFS